MAFQTFQNHFLGKKQCFSKPVFWEKHGSRGQILPLKHIRCGLEKAVLSKCWVSAGKNSASVLLPPAPGTFSPNENDLANS